MLCPTLPHTYLATHMLHHQHCWYSFLLFVLPLNLGTHIQPPGQETHAPRGAVPVQHVGKYIQHDAEHHILYSIFYMVFCIMLNMFSNLLHRNCTSWSSASVDQD